MIVAHHYELYNSIPLEDKQREQKIALLLSSWSEFMRAPWICLLEFLYFFSSISHFISCLVSFAVHAVLVYLWVGFYIERTLLAEF